MSATSFTYPSGSVPIYFNCPLLGADIVEQGTWADTNVGYLSCICLLNTSNGDGDSFSQYFWVPGGTYTFKMAAIKRSNVGYLTIYVDDIQIYYAGLYIASGTYAPTIITVNNLDIGPGKHKITFKSTAFGTAKSQYIYEACFYPSSMVHTSNRTFPFDTYACASPILAIPFFSNVTSIVQGTWPITLANVRLFYHYLNNSTAATNDALSMSVALSPGTYDIRGGIYTSTNLGILKGYLDGNLIFTKDMYSGSGVEQTWTLASDIVVSQPMISTFMIKIDGKNALSSGYSSQLSGFLFKKKS